VIDGLFYWFRQTPQTPQSISPTYDELIISQGQIGWSQLLLGRWVEPTPSRPVVA
jgi:hypothetical protein